MCLGLEGYQSLLLVQKSLYLGQNPCCPDPIGGRPFGCRGGLSLLQGRAYVKSRRSNLLHLLQSDIIGVESGGKLLELCLDNCFRLCNTLLETLEHLISFVQEAVLLGDALGMFPESGLGRDGARAQAKPVVIALISMPICGMSSLPVTCTCSTTSIKITLNFFAEVSSSMSSWR